MRREARCSAAARTPQAACLDTLPPATGRLSAGRGRSARSASLPRGARRATADGPPNGHIAPAQGRGQLRRRQHPHLWRPDRGLPGAPPAVGWGGHGARRRVAASAQAHPGVVTSCPYALGCTLPTPSPCAALTPRLPLPLPPPAAPGPSPSASSATMCTSCLPPPRPLRRCCWAPRRRARPSGGTSGPPPSSSCAACHSRCTRGAT